MKTFHTPLNKSNTTPTSAFHFLTFLSIPIFVVVLRSSLLIVCSASLTGLLIVYNRRRWYQYLPTRLWRRGPSSRRRKRRTTDNNIMLCCVCLAQSIFPYTTVLARLPRFPIRYWAGGCLSACCHLSLVVFRTLSPSVGAFGRFSCFRGLLFDRIIRYIMCLWV